MSNDKVAATFHGKCAPDCDERGACVRAGEVGHWQCRRCPACDAPRHHCGHLTGVSS